MKYGVMLGPSRTFGALNDFEFAGATGGVPFHRHFQQAFSGGKTTHPAANAPFDRAGGFGRATL